MGQITNTQSAESRNNATKDIESEQVKTYANNMPPPVGQARKLIHIPRKTRKLTMVEVTKRAV